MIRVVCSKHYKIRSLKLDFDQIFSAVRQQVANQRITGKNLTVCFVSRKKIREFNLKYRRIDKETDVLSFPCDFEKNYLGEIIICYKFAEQQARKLGNSLKREFSFLFLHGLLHLLNFDHKTLQQEEEMFSIQRVVLSKLGINREIT